MEFSSILKYGGYGLGGLFAVLVVVWIVVAARILRGTKGLTQALNLFFAAIVNGQLDAAYAMTTQAYRNQVNRKDFVKFIKQNQLKQYKTTRVNLPIQEGDVYRMEITAELKSGTKLPLSFLWKKQGKQWAVERLVKGEG